jgi:CopG family nickel-responsive transcriptional regulator
MGKLVRFGVSLDQNLIEKFDKHITQKNYRNRSEAIRDLIRQELVQKEWYSGRKVAGAVTIIYDHHRRELVNKVIHIQHHFEKLIIASQHVHLDHNNCLEIIAVKGNPQAAEKLVNRFQALKGIKHVTLSSTSTGRDLS